MHCSWSEGDGAGSVLSQSYWGMHGSSFLLVSEGNKTYTVSLSICVWSVPDDFSRSCLNDSKFGRGSCLKRYYVLHNLQGAEKRQLQQPCERSAHCSMSSALTRHREVYMGEFICYKHSKWEEHQVELTQCEVPVNPATRDILRKSGFIALVTLEFCKIQLFSWFQRCHVLSQPLK